MNDDPAEAKAWVNNLLKDRKALVTLSRVMTSNSWSIGMGGSGRLGDRVEKASVIAQIRNDSKIIDVDDFRNALKRVLNGEDIDFDERKDVQKFLDAWDRQQQGDG